MKSKKHIRKVIKCLQTMFFLQEWEIRISVDEKFPFHQLAKVGLHPTIRIADISFNKIMLGKHKKVPYNQWLQTIIHEMLHVRLANTTDGIVYRTRHKHKDSKMFYNEFIQNVEPEIESLAIIIFNLWTLK